MTMKISESNVFSSVPLGIKESKIRDIVNEDKSIEYVESSQLGLAFLGVKQASKFVPFVLNCIKLYELGFVKFYVDEKFPNIATFIPYKNPKTGVERVAVNLYPFLASDVFDEEVVNGRILKQYKIDVEMLRGVLIAAGSVLASFSSDGFRNVANAREAQIMFMSDLWLRSLNHISSLSADTDNASHFRYVFGKWVLASMYALSDDDAIGSFAFKLAGVKSPPRARAFDVKVSCDDLRGMNTENFIKNVLRVEFPALKSLDLKALVQAFTKYGTLNVLCIDYIPYVTACIASFDNDFMIYRNKALKSDLKKEARECFILTEMALEKRILFLLAQEGRVSHTTNYGESAGKALSDSDIRKKFDDFMRDITKQDREDLYARMKGINVKAAQIKASNDKEEIRRVAIAFADDVFEFLRLLLILGLSIEIVAAIIWCPAVGLFNVVLGATILNMTLMIGTEYEFYHALKNGLVRVLGEVNAGIILLTFKRHATEDSSKFIKESILTSLYEEGLMNSLKNIGSDITKEDHNKLYDIVAKYNKETKSTKDKIPKSYDVRCILSESHMDKGSNTFKTIGKQVKDYISNCDNNSKKIYVNLYAQVWLVEVANKKVIGLEVAYAIPDKDHNISKVEFKDMSNLIKKMYGECTIQSVLNLIQESQMDNISQAKADEELKKFIEGLSDRDRDTLGNKIADMCKAHNELKALLRTGVSLGNVEAKKKAAVVVDCFLEIIRFISTVLSVIGILEYILVGIYGTAIVAAFGGGIAGLAFIGGFSLMGILLETLSVYILQGDIKESWPLLNELLVMIKNGLIKYGSKLYILIITLLFKQAPKEAKELSSELYTESMSGIMMCSYAEAAKPAKDLLDIYTENKDNIFFIHYIDNSKVNKTQYDRCMKVLDDLIANNIDSFDSISRNDIVMNKDDVARDMAKKIEDFNSSNKNEAKGFTFRGKNVFILTFNNKTDIIAAEIVTFTVNKGKKSVVFTPIKAYTFEGESIKEYELAMLSASKVKNNLWSSAFVNVHTDEKMPQHMKHIIDMRKVDKTDSYTKYAGMTSVYISKEISREWSKDKLCIYKLIDTERYDRNDATSDTIRVNLGRDINKFNDTHPTNAKTISFINGYAIVVEFDKDKNTVGAEIPYAIIDNDRHEIYIKYVDIKEYADKNFSKYEFGKPNYR